MKNSGVLYFMQIQPEERSDLVSVNGAYRCFRLAKWTCERLLWGTDRMLGENSDRAESEEIWFCVRCQPRMEKLASESLKRLDEVNVFYPQTVKLIKSESGERAIRNAMFPGYLFASFDPQTSLRAVNYAQGISYIVRHGIEPVQLPAKIIEELKSITYDGVLKMPNRRPVPGQSVRILHGLFEGGEATVTKLIAEKKRIEVLFEILGSPCLIDVDEDMVDAGNIHPLQFAD